MKSTNFIEMSRVRFAILVLMIIYICTKDTAANEDDELEFVSKEFFDLKPGGEVHSFHLSEGEFVCTFTYAAQGGTDENWLMVLEWVDKAHTEISCRIDRPGGTSYLFFQQFELKGTPTDKYEFHNTDLTGSDGNDLPKEQYVVDQDNNAVSNHPEHFKNSLARVMIMLRRRKDEL